MVGPLTVDYGWVGEEVAHVAPVTYSMANTLLFLKLGMI